MAIDQLRAAPPTGERANGGVQSVERALDLLEALAAAGGDPVGVSDLAQAVGLPQATAHRLLATLVRRGYARREASRKYALGSRLAPLGDAAGRTFRGWVRPYLAELVELSGETANVAVLEDGHVVYVAQVPSRHRVRMFTEVGNRLLPHTSAAGKVLLAGYPRAEARRIIERSGLPARTPATITEPERFLAELDAVAERGWATDDQEEEVGVRCVAVALHGLGESPAAMSVSGPAERLEQPYRERLIPQMLRLAERITAEWTTAPGS